MAPENPNETRGQRQPVPRVKDGHQDTALGRGGRCVCKAGLWWTRGGAHALACEVMAAPWGDQCLARGLQQGGHQTDHVPALLVLETVQGGDPN